MTVQTVLMSKLCILWSVCCGLVSGAVLIYFHHGYITHCASVKLQGGLCCGCSESLLISFVISAYRKHSVLAYLWTIFDSIKQNLFWMQFEYSHFYYAFLNRNSLLLSFSVVTWSDVAMTWLFIPSRSAYIPGPLYLFLFFTMLFPALSSQ